MPPHHPRPHLARDYADALLGKTAFSTATDGLFVAGERRTGKSMFLRHDLVPELERRGVLALYVDLMENTDKTPTDALAQVLAQEVQKCLGVVAKAAKATGLDKISVPGVMTIDLKTIGKTDGLSLAQVLELIHKQTNKPIALLVDEAQHALTSEGGEALMWALKSARDQMKTPTGNNLMLLMSGSHADKLSLLLNSHSAPFWGSAVRQLPTLGDDFVDAVMADLRHAYPPLATVRGSVARDAFAHAGRRPPFFEQAIEEAVQTWLAQGGADASQFEAALLDTTRHSAERDRQGYTDIYLALAPLEQAVLARLIEQGRAFRPFDAPALAHYSQQLGETVGAAAVQKALDALRANNTQLVWKSQRGQYSVYDQGVLAWHAYLVAAALWPPQAA